MLYIYKSNTETTTGSSIWDSLVEKDGVNVDDDEFCNEFIIIKKAGSEQRHFQVVVIIQKTFEDHSFMLIAPFICNLSVCLCILQCPWLLYYLLYQFSKTNHLRVFVSFRL
jgi:hypothetical protein